MSRAALFLLAGALAACSGGDPGQTSLLTEAGLAARAVVQSRTAPKGPTAPGAVPAGLTRAAIAAETRPMVLVNLDTIGSAGTLLKTGENSGNITWVSQDRLTLTTKGGVAVATRGLVNDLLSAEVDPTLAALRAGGAQSYGKVLRHIGPDRQVEAYQLTCQMASVGSESVTILERSHATRHFAETCKDRAGTSLRNDYWLGADGTMWRSRQYLHALTGYIEIRRLIR